MRSWLRLLFSSHHPVSFKSAFSESNEGPDTIHRVRWFPFALFFVPSLVRRMRREQKGKKERERERNSKSKPNPAEYYTRSNTYIFFHQIYIYIYKCRGEDGPRSTLPVRIRTGSPRAKLLQDSLKNIPDKMPLIDSTIREFISTREAISFQCQERSKKGLFTRQLETDSLLYIHTPTF